MNDPKPPPQPPTSTVATDIPSKQPFGEGPDDPQAGVDTKEHSLADLREAARLAHRHGPKPAAPPTDPAADPDGTGDPDGPSDPDGHGPVEVDLVEAERQEIAEREATDPGAGVVEPDGDEPGNVDETGDRSGLSPIDPRIRDRRVAVTRAEGRRRLRILLAVVAVASAVGIAWLIVQSPFLAVKNVHVQGASRESASAVQEAAAVKEGSALLFLDTGAVARRVEALPWVAQAKVERELPTSLTITVIERSPVAWVRRPVPSGSPEGTLGTIVLVDRSGRVLGEEAQPPIGFPELVGMTRVPDRGDRIEPAAPARAVAELPDALRSQTRSLHRRRGQAVLELAAPPGGAEPAAGEVKLGNLEAIGAKGAAAIAVLDQLFAGREEVGYIDVRVPGAPATGD